MAFAMKRLIAEAAAPPYGYSVKYPETVGT